MIANLGCKLDYIWSQLKGTPVKGFPDCIPEGGKMHPKSGPHLLVASILHKELYPNEECCDGIVVLPREEHPNLLSSAKEPQKHNTSNII